MGVRIFMVSTVHIQCMYMHEMFCIFYLKYIFQIKNTKNLTTENCHHQHYNK